jgi:hypothetical protein
MASSWYDTQLIGELFEVIDAAAAPADLAVFHKRSVEAIARDNVGGVYRALFRLVASPQLLQANGQRVWRTYVDEGTFEVALGAPGWFEARVRGWSRHHRSACFMLRMMLESLLRAAGYKALVIERTSCVARGDPYCAFEGKWVP